MQLPTDAALQASVERHLRQASPEAVGSFGQCRLTLIAPSPLDDSAEAILVDMALSCPQNLHVMLADPSNPISQAIRGAARAVLPSTVWIDSWLVTPLDKPEAPQPAPHYADASSQVHNQAADATTSRVWNHLRFRSETEVRIAKALDEAGVLFFPNCKARLGAKNERQNREPDFLICYNGRWGIIEVDGEPYHPASRTAFEHARDRLFKLHGVNLVEHFDAKQCFEQPAYVVRQFLTLLEQA